MSHRFKFRALNIIELNVWFSKHNVPRYLGCVGSDHFLVPNRKIGGYVVNLQHSDQPGSHWYPVVSTRKNIIVMDSYGCPGNQEIVNFAKKVNKQVLYNDQIYQNIVGYGSDMCGYYAAFCLFQILKLKRDPIDVLYDFHLGDQKDHTANAKLLANFFKMYPI